MLLPLGHPGKSATWSAVSQPPTPADRVSVMSTTYTNADCVDTSFVIKKNPGSVSLRGSNFKGFPYNGSLQLLRRHQPALFVALRLPRVNRAGNDRLAHSDAPEWCREDPVQGSQLRVQQDTCTGRIVGSSTDARVLVSEALCNRAGPHPPSRICAYSFGAQTGRRRINLPRR